MDAEEFFGAAVVGAGADELERPKRSFELLSPGGFDAVLGGLAAKLKSPKSSLGRLSGLGCCEAVNAGFDEGVGFTAGLGVVSKKPPPLIVDDVICGGATEERCLEGLLKLAKGSFFG